MKKAKKWLALLLAVLTVATLITAAPAASAAGVSLQAAQQVVSALGIMVGDQNGNMMLDSYLTRSQMAKILVRVSGYSVTSSTISPFPDVPFTHWAAPYVSRAVALGYINGTPDGTFKPDQNATPEELAKTLLGVLGYTSTDYGIGWPWAQVNYAQKLGLFAGVTSQVGQPITRRDVMLMLYNTLGATAKSGKKYITVLGYATTASGDIDISSIIGPNSVGPITVRSADWFVGTGLNASSLSVYLNDKASTLASIQPYDVVYYSVAMNTAWVYDRKITGILQNTLPNRLSPSSVVISGTTYTLGSAAASTAVSYSGTFNLGDTVTLLLDRSGNVADVVPAVSTAAVTGFVTAAGMKNYTDPNGSTFNSYYIALLTLDGNKLEYQLPFDTTTLTGRVVTVSFTGGVADANAVASSNVNGKVSYGGMSIGGVRMSSDIKILDVDSYGNYVQIYPQRIDGITLSSSNVLFSQTDATGAITQLVLNTVTGDTSSYGVLTAAPYDGNPGDPGYNSTLKQLYTSYDYNIAGTAGSYKPGSTRFNASIGPAAFTFKNGSMYSINNLKSLGNVTLLDGDTVVANNGAKYLIWDKATIFKYSQATGYSVITAADAAGLTLTAYYDKDQSLGGRVRVIIAQ